MIETQIEASGYLEQLSHGIVPVYGLNNTVTAIVTGLLTYQTLTPLITIGTIQPTNTLSISWSNATILKCLNDMLDIVGGYFEVTDDRVFNWGTSIGEDKGQQIRVGKNLIGIEKDVDWAGLATRLYAVGSGIDLSDYQPEYDAVDTDYDATYGYLLLKDYKCYSGWTGAGDALPAAGTGGEIIIYEMVSEQSVSFENAGGASWTFPLRAIDGSTGPSAYYSANTWTDFLIALTEDEKPVLCTGVRWYIGADSDSQIIDIEVQITEDGDTWEEVVSAWDSDWATAWGQYDFPEPRLLTGMQIRVKSNNYSQYIYIYEMQMRTTYSDVSSDFVQGADERILRCAIGDFSVGATYYVSYTHAKYIKDFEAIETYGDIGFAQTFNYATDADTLLAWAQATLPTLSTPPVAYAITALNLSELDANFDFEELELGSTVKVIDEDLSIDTAGIVQSIEYADLLDPTTTTIEIAGKVQDISKAFRDIYNKI